ncbi:pyrroline-5-carboxylate reductase [Alphaproteobacteria bacterium]|nr:pyrroline-5-carboxylate reductase [Alphaproteobacteria bacterium]
MKNVVLFGFGKMGSSILKGWMLKRLNFNFFVVEKESSLRSTAVNVGIKSYQNFEQLLKFVDEETIDIIFLAVKPQQMSEAIKVFSRLNFSKILFISIAAGLSFDWFQSNLKKDIKLVRAMPNLPASVGFGVTGYCKTNNVDKIELLDVQDLLSAFGKAVYLETESYIDVVTAISGSGPAYVFYFAEVLSEIGLNQGLSKKNANVLAIETIIGSAKLLEMSNINPKILKENVTSPGGTTEAGLEILASEDCGLYNLLDKTVSAAKKRAKDLNSNG